MAKHAGTFDFIIDCVSAQHDINAYIGMLKRDGNITLVGAPPEPLAVAAFGLLIVYHVAMVFAPWAWVIHTPRSYPALIAPMALLTQARPWQRTQPLRSMEPSWPERKRSAPEARSALEENAATLALTRPHLPRRRQGS